MSDQDKTDGAQVRPFADVLREISRGTVHDDLSNRLQAVVAAVRELGGKGVVTLQLEVKPVKGDASALTVAARITSKSPEPEAPASVYFADEVGNLTRDDPRQMHLPLRGVDTDTPRSAHA